MDKNRKVLIIILSIAFIYLIVFLIFFGRKDSDSKIKNYINLVIGNDALFVYQNKKWRNITTDNRATYNWYLYDIYEESEKIGNYYLIYSGIWNLIDKDKNKVNLSFDDKLGVSSDLKYTIKNFNKTNNNIDRYINEVLSKYNITTTDLTANNVISIDIDNDSILEHIYTISNVFSEENHDKLFGFIFLVDDNEVKMIYEKIYDSNSLSGTCKPHVSNILELDSKNYIIVNCSYYSNLGKDVVLYHYKNKKFKEIISN